MTTEQQRSMLDYMHRVVGPPGCGKTTYLSRQACLAHEAGKEIMICSLTRTAAAEVVGQHLPIPPECIGTLHAHAYRAIRSDITGIANTPKPLAEWNDSHPGMALSGAERDIDEDNVSPPDNTTAGDRDYSDYQNNRARMLPRESWMGSTQAFAKHWEEWKKETGYADFTDLLAMCLDNVGCAPGNPGVVFADEAQDFSALEMALLQKWGKAAGELTIVGDPWQSLYEWRGADPDVFYSGEVSPKNLHLLPQSYRVPRAVHAKAIKWMEGMPGYERIEYAPTGAIGSCSTIAGSWGNPGRIYDTISSCVASNQTVMVLTSCAYMLGPIIKMLRAEGIPFHNTHRLKNGAWNPLKARRGSTTSAHRLAAYLHMVTEGYWTRDDLQTFLPVMAGSKFLPDGMSYKKAEPLIGLLPDGELSYDALLSTIGERVASSGMAGDCEWYYNNLQSARQNTSKYSLAIAQNYGRIALLEPPLTTIGTIHSVKGGEADTVILAPDLSVAGENSWSGSNAGRAAVHRLFYVGITRAKNELYILDPVNRRLSVEL